MIRFLCNAFVDNILPILILVVGLGVAIWVYLSLKKRTKENKDIALKGKGSKLEVKLKSQYATEQEMKILEYIHKAIPKDFIAFPRVGVNQIVEPTKNLIAYNSILTKYVDICVFYRKTMEPVLIIDLLWDNNEVKQQFKVMDDSVVNVLKAVKLNVMPLKVEPAYDIAELRKKILSILPDKMIAMLKKDYIEGK